jgi:predicted xylose isomerase-like sugar epimerase
LSPLFDDARKLRLLEWLTTVPSERSPRTKGGLADELGVSARTLRDWQAKDEFLREWEKRAREVAGDPERTQRVLDALFQTGVDSEHRQHVQAAKTFLEAIGAIKPHVQQVEVSGGVQQLSDEQLSALIAEHAAAQLGRQQ